MSTANDLLQTILANLDRGDAPDSKFPDARGEYWALCPFHPDRHATNFSVSQRGYKCFACGAQGGLPNLAQKLGVAGLHSCQGGNHPPPPPLTLEEHARAKNLPQDFLKGLGLTTTHYVNRKAVRMPYYDESGNEVAVRFRRTLTRKADRFRWRKGDKPLPYGLWKLNDAREAGYIILVEGESDSQTLWYHGVPALGIPGANAWQSNWAQYVAAFTLYVWREPDSGGAQFVNSIAAALPDALVLTPPDGRKDISECHVLGDDVPALLQELITHATPCRAIQAAARRKAAAQAKAQAATLLSCPDILAELPQLCAHLGLVGEDRNAKLLYLAIVSRLLDTPISVVVKGTSSAGKSFAVETVLKAFPETAFYALSSMSPRALAYSQEPLHHRMLVLYEASGLAADTGAYLLRTLLSENCIRHETVEKTRNGLQPRLIQREGPTGFITTTTWAALHPEIETRMLSLTVRDDKSHTKAIIRSLANRANGTGPLQPDLKPWRALQTWLELAGDRDVTIPYARELADQSSPSAVRLRRDFGTVLNLIKVHAILHQNHRQRQDGRIVAQLDDYRVVYHLVSDLISQGVQSSVRPTERETVEVVTQLYRANDDQPLTVASVASHLKLDKSAALRRVRVALRHGYLLNLEKKKHCPYRLVPGDPLPQDIPVLPHPHDLAAAGGVRHGGEGGSIPSNNPATLTGRRRRDTTMTTTELLAKLNQRGITLSLPPDTAMPVPVGRWQRHEGRILATYTPGELGLAIELALGWKLVDLEARLNYYLDVLAASTGCDDTKAERLLARWEALNADYAATITALAPVIGAD